ncbi:MAG: cell wall structural complex MreBCD transrane component MreD [Pseudomonadota bacterium]
MNRGETLAREPSLQLIVYSFLVAVAFNLLPWPPHLPLPDAVAALLVFWAAQAPRKMGLGLAWVLGLVMDAHSGVLLGEHALIYSLLTYGAVSLHRRLMGFGVAGQSMHIIGLFMLCLLAGALIRWLAEGTPLSGWLIVQSIANTLGWLVAHRILLNILKRRPGRRPVKAPKTSF